MLQLVEKEENDEGKQDVSNEDKKSFSCASCGAYFFHTSVLCVIYNDIHIFIIHLPLSSHPPALSLSVLV
jgi:hypothetical protein